MEGTGEKLFRVNLQKAKEDARLVLVKGNAFPYHSRACTSDPPHCCQGRLAVCCKCNCSVQQHCCRQWYAHFPSLKPVCIHLWQDTACCGPNMGTKRLQWPGVVGTSRSHCMTSISLLPAWRHLQVEVHERSAKCFPTWHLRHVWKVAYVKNIVLATNPPPLKASPSPEWMQLTCGLRPPLLTQFWGHGKDDNIKSIFLVVRPLEAMILQICTLERVESCMPWHCSRKFQRKYWQDRCRKCKGRPCHIL